MRAADYGVVGLGWESDSLVVMVFFAFTASYFSLLAKSEGYSMIDLFRLSATILSYACP
jgi:hypothetical protein